MYQQEFVNSGPYNSTYDLKSLLKNYSKKALLSVSVIIDFETEIKICSFIKIIKKNTDGQQISLKGTPINKKNSDIGVSVKKLIHLCI